MLKQCDGKAEVQTKQSVQGHLDSVGFWLKLQAIFLSPLSYHPLLHAAENSTEIILLS